MRGAPGVATTAGSVAVRRRPRSSWLPALQSRSAIPLGPAATSSHHHRHRRRRVDLPRSQPEPYDTATTRPRRQESLFETRPRLALNALPGPACASGAPQRFVAASKRGGEARRGPRRNIGGPGHTPGRPAHARKQTHPRFNATAAMCVIARPGLPGGPAQPQSPDTGSAKLVETPLTTAPQLHPKSGPTHRDTLR